MEKHITDLKRIINSTISNNYKKTLNLGARTRLKGMSLGLQEIVEYGKSHFLQEAKKYYKYRTESDKRLTKIQRKAFKHIRDCISVAPCFKNIEYELYPLSSFSSKTNLVGESDLDFGILVKRINPDKAICFSNALGNCGYMLTDIRQPNEPKKKHWVFQKYINGVEIEGKVRDYVGFKDALKMHMHTDHKMGKMEKIISTYVKYMLKANAKKYYEKFKMIFYCGAG